MARMIDGDKLVENLRLIATCWSISPYVSKETHNGAVDMLREVEREVKEAPTLTPPNEPERAGLYRKYTVYKNKDGLLVNDCFVLRPAKDLAAVAALRAYAAATDNAELAVDIINWVGADPNEPLTAERDAAVDADKAILWLKDYVFEDSRKIYTNGARIIPYFRVLQALRDKAYNGLKEGT